MFVGCESSTRYCASCWTCHAAWPLEPKHCSSQFVVEDAGPERVKQLSQGHTASVIRICPWVCLSPESVFFSQFHVCLPSAILLWPALGQASLGTRNCTGKVPALQVSSHISLCTETVRGPSVPSAGVSEPSLHRVWQVRPCSLASLPWDHTQALWLHPKPGC